jgi:calcineurin-like phosphoesterase
MTGPEDSILGVSKELVIERFLTRLPVRFEIANHPPLLCGLLAEVDTGTGKALSVTRIQERAH